MLREAVYAIFLTAVFYLIILVSVEFNLRSYPPTTFSIVGFVATFLMLFGTVNNVLQDL